MWLMYLKTVSTVNGERNISWLKPNLTVLSPSLEEKCPSLPLFIDGADGEQHPYWAKISIHTELLSGALYSDPRQNLKDILRILTKLNNSCKHTNKKLGPKVAGITPK